MPSPSSPRRSRILRRMAVGLAGLVLALGVGIAGALWFLGSTAGSAWIAARLEHALAEPGRTVAVTGLSGAPLHTRIDRIEIAGGDGPALRLEGLALDIDPAALLGGTLRIHDLSAATIELLRPLPSAAPSSGPTKPFALPVLPVGIELDRLAVDRVTLAPSIAGTAVALAVDGRGGLDRNGARVVLSLRRIDGTAGGLSLDATLGAAAGAPRRLDLALHASDPAGLILAGRPLALDVTGAGPLEAWRGRLSASAGSAAGLDATIAVDRHPGGVGIAVGGSARPAGLMPPAFATAIGDAVAFELHGIVADDGAVGIDRLSLKAAAAALAALGRFDPKNHVIAGRVEATATLAPFSAAAGHALSGTAKLTADLAGTSEQPAASITLAGDEIAFDGAAVAGATADLHLTPSGPRFRVTGSGLLDGLRVASRAPESVDWSLDLTTDRDGKAIELTRATASGGGLDVTFSGQAEEGLITGHAALAAADLSRWAAIAGSARLEIEATSPDGRSVSAHVTGRASELRTGLPAADALIGAAPAIDATIMRDAAGVIGLDRLSVTAAHALVDGSGRYEPGADRATGRVVVSLPDLRPLGRPLGSNIAGALTVTAAGTSAAATVGVTGRIAAGSARLDRIDASVAIDDLAKHAARLSATVGAGRLDAHLAAQMAEADGRLRIDGLSLTAPGSEVHGAVAIDLAAGRATGTLTARATDLSPWSALAGATVAGAGELSLTLGARASQTVDLKAALRNLVWGAATTVQAATADAHLVDVTGRPHGTVRLAAEGAASGDARADRATIAAASADGKLFDVTATTEGTLSGARFSVDAAGHVEPAGKIQRATLDRLAGVVHGVDFRLSRALTASRDGPAIALDGLELELAGGHVSAHGKWDGKTVSAVAKASDLQVGKLAQLGDRYGLSGRLAFDGTLDGALDRPDGHVVSTLDRLKLATGDVPLVNVSARADTAPGAIEFRGRIDGEKGGAALGFSGTLPVLFGTVPSVRQDGPLRAHLEGDGDVAALGELLPLGEDRLTGRYAVDLTVEGTVADPHGSGTLKLADGGYDNRISGLTLRGLQLELAGVGRTFELRRLEANDGGSGRLSGSGRVDLAATPQPTLDLKVGLDHFEGAHTDLATAVLSGTAAVGGALDAPRVTGDLVIERAEVDLAKPLPPNIVVLDVVRIDSSRPAPAAPPPPPTPPVVATLDVAVRSGGQMFVRGHGIDSEWRGRLAIAGTSATPAVTGRLEATRGTVSLLGTDFVFDHGYVIFTGSASPEFDISAAASASGITAKVAVTGPPEHPKLALSSDPPLPQDEVLSRVMFGSGASQLTPAQGLQLASTVASLTQGGPGVLDRLRSFTGLDRLAVGQASPGQTSQQGGSGVASGTSVSGGKYVAPGIFVGAAQTVGGATSAQVEVQLTPHITAKASAAAIGSGSSLGVVYQRDY